jgi:phosphatidylglycerophosphate synthase
LVLVRDVAILVVGAVVLARRHIRIEVRMIGKVATFTLMCAIPAIAWGNLELPLGEVLLVLGWAAFAIGIVESYVAAGAYLGDIRRALAEP